MSKGKPCEVYITSPRGYSYTSLLFPSIRQAEAYARDFVYGFPRDFVGGFHWTIYEVVDGARGRKIKSGYCRGD